MFGAGLSLGSPPILRWFRMLLLSASLRFTSASAFRLKVSDETLSVRRAINGSCHWIQRNFPALEWQSLLYQCLHKETVYEIMWRGFLREWRFEACLREACEGSVHDFGPTPMIHPTRTPIWNRVSWFRHQIIRNRIYSTT